MTEEALELFFLECDPYPRQSVVAKDFRQIPWTEPSSKRATTEVSDGIINYISIFITHISWCF